MSVLKIDKETPLHFLLVGNGPYKNRGCEAIVRGTMVILRHEFGEDFHVTVASFENPIERAEQEAGETDPLISHVALSGLGMNRWSAAWWQRQLLTRWLPSKKDKFSMLDQACKDASCALQIGGDNFTLDYVKRPWKFMALSQYLQRHDVPVGLWGASVGPFEDDPKFARKLFQHFRTMRTILVRESVSFDYLQQRGLGDNLDQMSDPAFVMDPLEPPLKKIGCDMPPDAIGLNLSPLMANYITGGDMGAWVKMGAEMVQSIVAATNRKVLLIPHVTCAHSNDHTFLSGVISTCSKSISHNVLCLSDKLTAAETKWVISRCLVFAGARTHSTIGAFSSGVPTLSLAYSRKALGLNQDMFGSQDYCLQPSEISPTTVTERIQKLIKNRESIHIYIKERLHGIRNNALKAGAIIRDKFKI